MQNTVPKMIILTINPEVQPIAHHFNKTSVTIGHKGDLNIPSEILEDIHIQIFEQGGTFVIFNEANDPFVTLNGLPFGKKNLKPSDTIRIGNTSIRFETGPFQHSSPAQAGEHLAELLEQALMTPSKVETSQIQPTLKNVDYDAELEKLDALYDEIQTDEASSHEFDNDLETIDIDGLMQQVEELERLDALEEKKPLEPASMAAEESHLTPDYDSPLAVSPANNVFFQNQVDVPQEPLPVKTAKASLKDYYLSEFDDENEELTSKKQQAEAAAAPSNWNWKLIGAFLGGLIAILTLAGYFIYGSISGRNDEDEIKAAAGVADIAMALTQAQMTHSNPPNQNWSDREFIRNNLFSVLAPTYSPTEALDAHDQNNVNSYMIRIYTSNDLSQFIVIAQPSPSLMHWLIPKASIIVDSKQMEMRKINDLKLLNRLLLNPSPLDGSNANEISQIIKQGELISLSAIASKKEKQGFAPPKVLGSIRPGAENQIYNAPRYYPFGEGFLRKAISLTEKQNDLHEIETWQQDVKALMKYPHIILYSSQGLQWARQAQKALNLLLPQHKILVAYLKFNSKGLISSSNYVIDDGGSDIAIGSPVKHAGWDHATYPAQEEDGNSTAKEDKLSHLPFAQLTFTPNDKVDPNHPLLRQLCALETSEKKGLQSVEKNLTNLLNEAQQSDIAAFLSRVELLLKKNLDTYEKDSEQYEKAVATIRFLESLQQILNTYAEEAKQQKEQTIQSLSQLYREYSQMPLEQFMEYVKAAGLESFVQQNLDLQERRLAADPALQTLIEDEIQKIKLSHHLQDLQQQVDKIGQMLQLGDLADHKKLITYQSATKLQVLDKLNDFLLSKEKGLPSEEFTDKNRGTLVHILKSAWVTDPDEFEFYTAEFEARSQQISNSSR